MLTENDTEYQENNMLASIDPAHPFIQLVCSGGSGCRFYRASMPGFTLNWFEGLGFHCIEVPQPLLEPGMLNATRAIVLKSAAGWQGFELLKQLAAIRQKFPHLRIVNDFDDVCFGNNVVREGDSDFEAFKMKEFDDRHNASTIEALKLCDLVTTTNSYLAKKFEEVGARVKIIPNAVPRSMWSLPRREPAKEDLKVINVTLTQCPQHAVPAHKDENGNDVKARIGDYESAEWREWLVKHVKDGDIRLTQMGGPSFMWDGVQERVRSLPWVTPNRFASLMTRTNPDLVIAPMVPCELNRCRSDLRYVEAAVCSAAFLGSDFPDSPYANVPEESRVQLGATVEQLDEKLRMLKDMDTFNSLVERGWKFLVEDGRIMESEQCLARYVEAWAMPPKNQINFDLI